VRAEGQVGAAPLPSLRKRLRAQFRAPGSPPRTSEANVPIRPLFADLPRRSGGGLSRPSEPSPAHATPRPDRVRAQRPGSEGGAFAGAIVERSAPVVLLRWYAVLRHHLVGAGRAK